MWTVRRQTTPGPGGLIDKGTKGKRARTVPIILDGALAALRAVHTVDGPSYGRISAPDSVAWMAFLTDRLASYAATLTRLGQAAIAAHRARVRTDLAPLADVRPHLLHGDPHPGNFRLRAGRVVPLDWELATYGDPQLDLVRFAWEWRIPPRRWRQVVGIDPDEPAIVLYRHIHLLGRVMGAISRGSVELAGRYLANLPAELAPQPARPGATHGV